MSDEKTVERRNEELAERATAMFNSFFAPAETALTANVAFMEVHQAACVACLMLMEHLPVRDQMLESPLGEMAQKLLTQLFPKLISTTKPGDST